MEASAAPIPPAAEPRRRPLVPQRLLRVASDERLVSLVRSGSQPAFEVLFDRHHRGLLSFCRHMLGTREEAEDAVQHTFMAAYRDMVGSDKELQLRAWLYAIARNRCLSVLRARREHPSDEIEEAVTEGLAVEVQRRADLQDMLRDLADLPEDQRAALVLSELGALPHDEIAQVIGCPKDKVKALVFQARSSLQSSREARETSCQEIREMLSTLSGGSLRRTTLRRHLRDCAGCRDFEAEVKRQRRAMAAVLPVIPTLGFRDSALAAVFGSKAAAGGAAAVAGGAAATAAGGGLAGGGAGAVAAKVLVAVALTGGGAVGANQIVAGDNPVREATPAGERSQGPKSPAPLTPVSTPDPKDDSELDKAAKERKRSARRRGHTDRGKEFAKTRGKGKKRGLLGTQPGKNKSAAGEKAERKLKTKTRTKRARKAKPRPRRQVERKPRPQPTPRPAPKPKPEKPQPAPQSAPQPTPEPTPTVVPTVDPENPGRG